MAAYLSGPGDSVGPYPAIIVIHEVWGLNEQIKGVTRRYANEGIIKYDLNGWLGVVGGPLEYIENSIKSIKGQASQVNKNPDKFQIIISASPNVIEGQSSKSYGKRFPFSGSIDEIGSDIQRLKDMGVDHIVFVYNFLPIGRDVNEMIDISKQLSKFAR
jgi:hypothetical protein